LSITTVVIQAFLGTGFATTSTSSRAERRALMILQFSGD
jgi:hypothetical protein